MLAFTQQTRELSVGCITRNSTLLTQPEPPGRHASWDTRSLLDAAAAGGGGVGQYGGS